MSNDYWVNYGDHSGFLDIKKTEQKFEAKYICDMAVRKKGGGWTNSPAAIFYCPNPPKPEYSKYFGIFVDGTTRQAFIFDALPSLQDPIHAIKTKSGEVIFSRWVHDFRRASTSDVCVDGGRDYLRVVGNSSVEEVLLEIKDGELIISKMDDTLVVTDKTN